jgi:hypothetical protein
MTDERPPLRDSSVAAGGTPSLSKIRKLLALAEDPSATPAESAAFTEKAMALMARHGIDEALLSATADRPGRVANLRLVMPPPYARDKATLAASIAMALRCKPILLTRGKDIVLQIFGFESDVRNADALFSSLLVQAAHELVITPIPPHEHPAAFRRSWWVGFAVAVNARLEQANREAESRADRRHENRARGNSDSSSVALVLAHRADEIEEAVAEVYPKVQRGRQRRLSGGGRAEGYRSGQRVDMGLTAKIAAR